MKIINLKQDTKRGAFCDTYWENRSFQTYLWKQLAN